MAEPLPNDPIKKNIYKEEEKNNIYKEEEKKNIDKEEENKIYIEEKKINIYEEKEKNIILPISLLEKKNIVDERNIRKKNLSYSYSNHKRIPLNRRTRRNLSFYYSNHKRYPLNERRRRRKREMPKSKPKDSIENIFKKEEQNIIIPEHLYEKNNFCETQFAKEFEAYLKMDEN